MTAAVWAMIPGCGPLRQPLGSLEQQGADGSTPPGTIISTQTPDLPPEWGSCNPAVFRCFQDPAVPVSPPVSELFSGVPDPDPASKPIVVYPLAGSMHPINLADITFQWRRGPGVAQTVFRIRLQRGNGDRFEFYVPCKPTGPLRPSVPTECVYQLPPGAWLDTAIRARGEVVTVDVAGVDPLHPRTVATSDAMTLSFSPESITGGSPQLWMTAIDVRKLPAGDASSPPVWLPFQDVMVRNYLGCWSERIGCRVDTAGGSIGCGDAEVCMNGSCAMVAR